VGKRFSAPVHTGPGLLTDSTHQSRAEVKERVVTPLLPIWAFMVCSVFKSTFSIITKHEAAITMLLKQEKFRYNIINV
jgi:hypothetical protein